MTISIIQTILTAAINMAAKPEEIHEKLIAYITSMNLDLEVLETLCLSRYYIQDVYSLRPDQAHLPMAVTTAARAVLTESCAKEDNWSSPCIQRLDLSLDRLTSKTGPDVLYELPMTFIGYGINQALFGIFRNFREPGSDINEVITLAKQAKLQEAISGHMERIRHFVRFVLELREDSPDIVNRCSYTLGLIRNLETEMLAYTTPAFTHRVKHATNHEAQRLAVGLFRLVRYSTRILRCELSHLCIKSADSDAPFLKAIAHHARESAMKALRNNTFRK